MVTPASGETSYALQADFTVRYDWRSAAQLLSDTETTLTQAQVEASATLLTLLEEASGEVESATLVSNRYVLNDTQNDLDDLTGNSLEHLKGIVCTLAAEKLYRRRPDLLAKIAPQVEAAREQLDLLRHGERIFGTVEHAAAGLPGHHTETMADEEERRGFALHTERLLGQRGWRRRGE